MIQVEQIREFPNQMRDVVHEEVRKLQRAGYRTRVVRITGGDGSPGCWAIAFYPAQKKIDSGQE